jgi:triosephosphate isomerase
MRRKLVVANRKMHGSVPGNKAFLEGLLEGTRDYPNADYVVCFPHPYLYQAQTILSGTHIAWGGQNMSRYESGPYTGSVSSGMLAEFGCKYVIIGHSERRNRGHDSDNSVGERFLAAIKAGLTPIFCMGETREEFEQGLTDLVTIRQLNALIQQVGIKNLTLGILAYEPVWAIGTGNAATPAHAQSILHFLRGYLILKNPEVGKEITILYGGSMNGSNASDLLSMPDIDGGLVGTASLNTDEFVAICQAANSFMVCEC